MTEKYDPRKLFPMKNKKRKKCHLFQNTIIITKTSNKDSTISERKIANE